MDGCVAGAGVSTGIPESTLGWGVAAGNVATEGLVGTAMASAGCNALGAEAESQQNHMDIFYNMQALTIE